MILGLVLMNAVAGLDPTAIAAVTFDQIEWQHNPLADTAILAGDPARPGLYVQLIRWKPHQMSRPHFHNNVRYVTVLKGTWWVGSGAKYDPDSTVPMHAGTVVTDIAKGLHYDGAKDEEAIIEIVGEGPVTTTQAEVKP